MQADEVDVVVRTDVEGFARVGRVDLRPAGRTTHGIRLKEGCRCRDERRCATHDRVLDVQRT